MNPIDLTLEAILNRYLENIKDQPLGTFSQSEERFFQALSNLYQSDYERGNVFAEKYKHTIIRKADKVIYDMFSHKEN